jgi:hypothetical protein
MTAIMSSNSHQKPIYDNAQCQFRLFSISVCLEPGFAQFNAARSVHIKQADRGASFSCQAHDISPSTLKVITPCIFTGIEKRYHGVRVGIDAREVRPFICVAAVARESQRIGHVRAAMLPRDDVFNVKGNKRRCLL